MEDHDLIPMSNEPTGSDPRPPEGSEPISSPLTDQTASESTLNAEPAPPLQQSLGVHPWRRLTRRQMVAGVGVVAGVVAVGGGMLLALQANPSSPVASTATRIPGRTPHLPRATSPAGPLPPSTPVPQSVLQAWRTKQLTVPATRRFQHHTGTDVVPLGIIEPTYPNPYSPYRAHLHLYLLGGELVTNQLFWYVGLEAQDGTQFVAKVRVGPVDQSTATFGLQVTQQSTDDIEGGPAEAPQVSVTPRTLYQAMPSLVQHCLVVTLTPKPVPADADGLSSSLRSALNQQATISNQFLQFDFDVLHRTPFAQVPPSERNPIQGLIDTSSIRYHSAADGANYPLITQVVFRHSDQLYSKLVAP
jgi:hypothetical protein